MIGWNSLSGLGAWQRADPYYGSVVLLLHFNGADGATSFPDEKGHTLTAQGNAQLDTANFKFGTAALLLDGTGDYATAPDSTDWDMGAGDFTIESWVYVGSAVSTIVLSHWVSGGGTARAWSLESNSDGSFTGVVVVDAVAYSVTSGVYSGAAWRHLAFQRSGSTLTLFVDGVSVDTDGTIGTGAVNSSNGNLAVGAYSGGQQPFNGAIDCIRVTRGSARYPAAGFPVSGPFPNY